MALISIIGLIGSLGKVRGCITFYATTVTIVTILNIGAGIFFVWTLFRHSRSDAAIDRCVNGTDGDIGKIKHWVCDKGFHIIRIVIVILFVIVWIFQLVGIFIVFDYRGQLNEEAELEDNEGRKGAPTFVISAPTATGGPAMRTTYDAAPYDSQAGGWASSKSPYAFNLPENAHGAKP
jgi:heme/copper-type cytochrome/quinol oxidase subunit 2